jgi:hypothetical protein
MERLEGIHKSLITKGLADGMLPSASRGDEREIFIREFLGKVFPQHFRFGRGSITDSTGECSGQIDIVMEFPFFASFPVPPGDVRLYIAEGVVAAIEVKSNLVSQWSEIESTTEKVKKLTRKIIAGISRGGQSPQVPVFAVGYTGYKSITAAERRLENTKANARPDGILVLK